MLRKEFEINMKSRFRCSKEAIKMWIAFAEENVSFGHYVNFMTEPDEQAVQGWLDGIFSALYFLQKQAGTKIVDEIFQLSENGHCLYPREIVGTIGYLKSGGDTKELLEKSLNGELDCSGNLPTLDDVKKDLAEKRKKREKER